MSWVTEKATRLNELISRLNLFDANLWLGPPQGFPLAKQLTLSELLNEMKRHFISGGLISHWWEKTLSAQAGNQALAELAAQGHLPDKIHSIWTGLPLSPADEKPLPGFESPDKKMRGMRIFPKSHNYLIETWVFGSLCDWLIQQRLPLFIWHTETDAQALYQLATAFPELQIIIKTQTKKSFTTPGFFFP